MQTFLAHQSDLYITINIRKNVKYTIRRNKLVKLKTYFNDNNL